MLQVRPKILVVEDSPEAAEMLASMIEVFNAETVTATDGLRALEVVEAAYESAERGRRVQVEYGP